LPAAENLVDVLLRVASNARYLRSPDGRIHARVPVNNRQEVFELGQRAFRDWLIKSFRTEFGVVPSDFAVRRALSVVEANARFDDATPSVHIRVAGETDGSERSCYFDLGDPSGRAIWIIGQDWEVVDRPPVNFRRPAGMLPLPIPRHDGSIELLRPFVNLNDTSFRLLVAWLAAAMLPEGPYPILTIHGEHGAAKSTLTKVARLLIDPQISPVLAEPRSTRDLMVTAVNGWLLAYDNISAIPTWLSDGLCRLATGGGFASRTLQSNDQKSVIYAQRPVILNGIDAFVRRDDLADRCVFLHLEPIADISRRAEGEFWRAFNADYPAILGGLLDAVAGGLGRLPSIQLAALPRMADFACLGEAVGRGLGWKEGEFLSAYAENRQATTLATLEDSVLADLIILSADLGGLRNYTRSATDMLRSFASDVEPRVRASARWLKSPRAFADELRRLAPALRTQGIYVEFGRTNDKRLITINADPNFDRSRKRAMVS
jgi:hypothetical protein